MCRPNQLYIKRSRHSLGLDVVGGSAGHLSVVAVGFAAVPQVDESLADPHQHHGHPGAQAGAVTGHLHQAGLLHCLPTHAVQPPII